MSKKNTLESKKVRREAKVYDRGYPEYYVEVPTKYNSKLVPFHKIKEDKPTFLSMATFYLGGVLERLGLVKA